MTLPVNASKKKAQLTAAKRRLEHANVDNPNTSGTYKPLIRKSIFQWREEAQPGMNNLFNPASTQEKAEKTEFLLHKSSI